MECTRKANAEDFPRNFALIRLAEKTIERHRKEKEDEERKRQEEQAAQATQEKEIAEL